MICIACNHEHDENFCPNCGERNGVKKLTFSSILTDALVSVTEMDKGFLFNLKSLISKPQKITTDYVSGRRKGILNPTSYLILAVTFYLLIITVFKVPKEFDDINDIAPSYYERIGQIIGKFIRSNLKFFWIVSIFPLGLSLKLIFKKYNFIENLAISSFIVGQATLVAVISYLIFRIPLIFDPFVYLAILWLVYKVFKDKSDRIEGLLTALGALFLFIFQLVLIIVLIGVVKA